MIIYSLNSIISMDRREFFKKGTVLTGATLLALLGAKEVGKPRERLELYLFSPPVHEDEDGRYILQSEYAKWYAYVKNCPITQTLPMHPDTMKEIFGNRDKVYLNFTVES